MRFTQATTKREAIVTAIADFNGDGGWRR